MEGFSAKSGPSAFTTIYGLTLADICDLMLGAPESRCGLLLARKRKIASLRDVWIYVLERLFDLASAAVMQRQDCFFSVDVHPGGAASKLEVAARTTGLLFFCRRPWAVAFSRFTCGCTARLFWSADCRGG